MNRKELDLIAKSLHEAKPGNSKNTERMIAWYESVTSVIRGLVNAGHLVSKENIQRFEGIADRGIIRGSV